MSSDGDNFSFYSSMTISILSNVKLLARPDKNSSVDELSLSKDNYM